MKQWMMKSDRDAKGNKIDFEQYGKQFHVSKVLARLLVNRHLNTRDKVNRYLFGGLENLENPYLLKNIEAAAAIIRDAAEQGKHIRIIGDYDVDGVMSTYILKEGLRICGFSADYRIPNRILHGYGINPALVEEAYQEGVELLITCDNGISAKFAVERALELGIKVIITDHHEVPYTFLEDGTKEYLLPPANAIVNGKLPDCPYPMKGICGAYTAFRLVQVLYDLCQRVRREQGVAKELIPLVGFAALATVCDVMELVGENRILVKEGLKLLPKTENAGMLALIRECGLEGKELNSYHFGFILGPCINSAGRLYSADKALELFFMKSENQIAERAKWLVSLNQQRKQMTQEGMDKAVAIVEHQLESQGRIDDVLVLYLPDCHESIAGIVAAKVKERYFRPTIILTDPAEGSDLKEKGIMKGSGRSTPMYSMFEKLSECRKYLLKFGGHPLAAGLSLKKENIDSFRIELNKKSGLMKEDFIERISADCMLPFSELSLELIEELKILQPFGTGNDDPIFGLTNVKILSARYMGAKNQYLRLSLSDDSGYAQLESPIFRDVDVFINNLIETYGEMALENLLNHLPCDYRMSILYYPEINEFRDRRSIQVRLIDFRF